eukprot:CAMPEP_0197012600 /NCGR_PEP_ID=MMETSP1380-20130617/63090_1 /TAXON_ID=5936 /ORGANISM="Euplotes crassus, Strain CT5" /LENGTH=107 /DNA_ID=CAMNT_0042436197 /DNA_START=954 /DNA_END=1273 /DNA_ORIENTATION=-
MPQKGVPLIFETFMPWSNENPAQISIEWERNMHHMHESQSYYGSGHETHSMIPGTGAPHYHDPYTTSRSHSPINAPIAATQMPDLSNKGGPQAQELTHGTIFIGISG